MFAACAVLDLQLVPVENVAEATAVARGFAHTLHETAPQCGLVARNFVRLNRSAQVGWSTLVSASHPFPAHSLPFANGLCAPLPRLVSLRPRFGHTRADTLKF